MRDNCYEEKIFRNIANLLKSQKSIDLTTGIVLRRKTSENVTKSEKWNCSESLKDFEGNVDRIFDDFVLEFDMLDYVKGLSLILL